MQDQTATYDFQSRTFHANRQATYERMRAENPFYRAPDPFMTTGKPMWIITRYADALAVLKSKVFGREFRRLQTLEQRERFPIGPTDHWMLHRDPPDHTRLRSLVHKAFTPRIVQDLRPRIQQIADDLLDDLADKGEIDLLAEFAVPVPVIVICELLGIPVEDRHKFREWSMVFTGQSTQDEALFFAAVQEFIEYMNRQIVLRRQNPRGDLISALVAAEDEGEQLSHEEVLSMLQLLLIAGHETTVNLIANGTLALLDHPDQLRKLRDHPEYIQTAVEEMLRYDGPVDWLFPRYAFEDTEIGGQVIRTGEMVQLSMLAADRDPALFESPNAFDITRQDNKHMAFGNGIHYCVGAPLARIEGEIAINAMLRRLPNLALNADPADLQWSESLILHGLKWLPVRV